MAYSTTADCYEISTAFSCCVCFDLFETPKILPICGHSLCLNCVTKIAGVSKAVICPECRTINPIGLSGIQGFATNLQLQRAVDAFRCSTFAPAREQACISPSSDSQQPSSFHNVFYGFSMPMNLIDHTTTLTENYQQLRLAVERGDLSTVQKIINFSNLSFSDLKFLLEFREIDRTLLKQAVIKGDFQIAKTFLRCPNTQEIGQGIADCAFTVCNLGNLEIFLLLIFHQPSLLQETDEFNMTLLHRASKAGQLEVVKFLLTRDLAGIDRKGRYGNTALHFAVEDGHVAVAKTLIEFGADVFARDDHNRTPLHLACYFEQFETIGMLIDCDPSLLRAMDNFGNTACRILISRNHHQMAEYLRKRELRLSHKFR